MCAPYTIKPQLCKCRFTLPWPSRLGGAHSDTAFICGIVIQCMVDAVQNTKSQCWQSSQISYQKQAFSPHVPLGWTFSFFFFLMTFKSIHNVLLFRPNLKLREVWLTQQPQGRDSRIVSEPWHSFREAIFKEMKGLEFSRIITPVVPVSQFAPCQVPHGPPLRKLSPCVWVKGCERRGFLGDSVPLLSTSVKVLAILQSLLLLGSHHCLGTKTAIEAYFMRKNQVPFFSS